MAQLGVIWADGIWNTAIWNTAIWAQSSPVDVTAPTLLSAVIVNDTLRLAFDEAVKDGGAGLATGLALTLSGGACTATYSSGATTSTLVYSLSRTPDTAETGTFDYTQPGNGVEDIAGNDLASIVAGAVTILATSIFTQTGMRIGIGIGL